MGEIKAIPPVKLFCGVTFNNSVNPDRVLPLLSEKFGIIQEKSEVFDFSFFTDYYSPEMGSELKKLWVVFTELIHPGKLAEIKIQTNELEKNWVKNGKRLVNLDPGYLEPGKMILATTKNYSHRVYLTRGIFGDVHLIFRNKKFEPMPWTYPDYKQKTALSFFETVRGKLLIQLGEK